MKKKVLSLLLVAAMGISMLVGCGGTTNKPAGSENAGTNNSEAAGPVDITLTVWCPQNQIDSGLIDAQTKAFAYPSCDEIYHS